MTDIKLSELPEILKSDLSSEDLVLVSRAGQWSKTIAVGEFLDLSADNISTGILPVERGGAGSDLSLTGGTKHFIKQSALGANLSSGVITSEDLPTNLNLVTNIGGASSLSVGGSSSSLTLGHSNTINNSLFGQSIGITSGSCSITSTSCNINSNLTAIGNNINVNTSGSGNVTIGNPNTTISINGINSNGINLSGGLSVNGQTIFNGNITQNSTNSTINCTTYTTNANTIILGNTATSISATGTVTTNLTANQIVTTNQSKQLSTLTGNSNSLIGFDNSQALTQYNVAGLITLLGTSSLNTTANINILNNGTLVGTRRGFNLIPTGLTINCTDNPSSDRVDINIINTADSTASRIYLWSNYR